MPHRHISFTPPVVARRGAGARAPENTLAAFKAAHDSGAVWLQADVKLTADGAAILMHDDTLDRTTDGHGAVAETNLAELRRLDAGAWFGPGFKGTRVPLLADLLSYARAAGMRVNLEIRPCPGRATATAMVALIEVAKAWPASDPPPLISSLDVEALTVASQLHPGWPRGLILDRWREDWRETAALTQASTLHVSDALLTPERLTQLQSAGLPILAYTVNDAARAQLLLEKGVRAVFCDDPAALLAA